MYNKFLLDINLELALNVQFFDVQNYKSFFVSVSRHTVIFCFVKGDAH